MANTESHLFTDLGFVQFDVRAGDLEANRKSVHGALTNLADTASGPALVVLPELWSTGFDYQAIPGLARETPHLLGEIQDLARRTGFVLAGSLAEEDQGRFYNTLYVTGPTGLAGKYRKQHLFPPMDEDRFFTPGAGYGPIDTPYGRLAGLICYDLRFPELARNQVNRKTRYLVIPAQWPLVRVDHWLALIRARAIENQLFVIAANRCGITEETEFAGHSTIIAPDGTILHQAGTTPEEVLIQADPTLVDTVRTRFTTLQGS